jgi:hypothetical protein
MNDSVNKPCKNWIQGDCNCINKCDKTRIIKGKDYSKKSSADYRRAVHHLNNPPKGTNVQIDEFMIIGIIVLIVVAIIVALVY